MPRTFYIVLLVQFVSTLADNALLIVAIAHIIELDGPAWIIPVVKISFTLFYVLLAPVVGPLADAFPKGRVMLCANALKACAVTWMVLGANPALAILLAGLGAAIYAPAKYGLITELLPSNDLVRANGFFESVTVCAVLLGTALGGFLVSPVMPVLTLPAWFGSASQTPTSLLAGMLSLLALNVLATVLSAAVTDSGARYAPQSIRPVEMLKRFVRENQLLWRDPMGGMSMTVTTLLWGVGATLQLIVLRWAHEAIGLSLTHAAYLQGITALGLIAGAILASRFVILDNTIRLLPIGTLIGILVPTMLFIDTLPAAITLLLTVGALAGFFVVPMNALLQHRGCQLLTAGRSIAVQGFNENAGMLLMLAAYAAGTALNVPLATLIWALGILITVSMTLIYLLHRSADFRINPSQGNDASVMASSNCQKNIMNL